MSPEFLLGASVGAIVITIIHILDIEWEKRHDKKRVKEVTK